jgi:O-methyltransferase involved in polyketide biosynthesis
MEENQNAPGLSLSHLSSVPYTLVIPLSIRAYGGRIFPKLQFEDLSAERILKNIDVDYQKFLGSSPIIFGILERSRIFIESAKEFFEKNPRSVGVNFGCGLSHYFQWLDFGQNYFVDCDLPEVMELRQKLLKPLNERHRFLVNSLTYEHWWDSLELPRDTPIFLMIEGVSMYLQKNDIEKILDQFVEHAPSGSELVMDVMSWFSVGKSSRHHPMMKRIRAQFRWGIRHWSDLTRSRKRLSVLSVHRVMQNYRFAYSFADWIFLKITGVPFYSVVRLRVS